MTQHPPPYQGYQAPQALSYQPPQPMMQPRSSEEIHQALEALRLEMSNAHQATSQGGFAQQEPVATRYVYPHLLQLAAIVSELLRDYNTVDPEDAEDGGSPSLAYANLVEIVVSVVEQAHLPAAALSALLLGLHPCMAELHGMDQVVFEARFAPQIARIKAETAAAAAMQQNGHRDGSV